MRRGAGVREEEREGGGGAPVSHAVEWRRGRERTDRERVWRLVEWWRERWSEGTLNPAYI
jgi:hypothetical protein